MSSILKVTIFIMFSIRCIFSCVIFSIFRVVIHVRFIIILYIKSEDCCSSFYFDKVWKRLAVKSAQLFGCS